MLGAVSVKVTIDRRRALQLGIAALAACAVAPPRRTPTPRPPHPRNVSDAALRACADRGGVAGIHFMPLLRAAGQPTSDDRIRHLEHAINVTGEDPSPPELLRFTTRKSPVWMA